MLILTRRAGERRMLGEHVVVTVLGVEGDHIRLGIDAPREVPAHRAAIYARIQRVQAEPAKLRIADEALLKRIAGALLPPRG